MYMYITRTHTHTYTYVYIYIYIYRYREMEGERERERERERAELKRSGWDLNHPVLCLRNPRPRRVVTHGIESASVCKKQAMPARRSDFSRRVSVGCRDLEVHGFLAAGVDGNTAAVYSRVFASASQRS